MLLKLCQAILFISGLDQVSLHIMEVLSLNYVLVIVYFYTHPDTQTHTNVFPLQQEIYKYVIYDISFDFGNHSM